MREEEECLKNEWYLWWLPPPALCMGERASLLGGVCNTKELLCVLFVCCRAYPFVCVGKEMVYKTNSIVVCGLHAEGSHKLLLLSLHIVGQCNCCPCDCCHGNTLSLFQRMHTRNRQWLMVMPGSWMSWTRLGRYEVLPTCVVWSVPPRDHSLSNL